MTTTPEFVCGIPTTEYNKIYYKWHRDWLLQLNAIYYKHNRTARIASRIKWQKEHPEETNRNNRNSYWRHREKNIQRCARRRARIGQDKINARQRELYKLRKQRNEMR